MPKIKTHKGAKKRFKITGTGKVKREKSSNKKKFLVKSSSQKRRLEIQAILEPGDARRVKKILPYV